MFLTLCASVGSEKVSTLFDARCNHEVYVFLLLCLYILFVMLRILLFVSVFLLSCTFRSGYSVSLCCSVCCLCVNVYCTAATGCQPNCS